MTKLQRSDRGVRLYETAKNHVFVGNDAPIVPKKIGIQSHGTARADPYDMPHSLFTRTR
ncbi:hypothetical protein HNQ80_005174 [Anaerosolibacter carboniphilus]|uniref:Uncharacterized protein n=1 Tax=Anaerosolibacter carboniphilus TaxID=1417629 RepID=A0A841KYZ1_9FIRM|nr:hypothetical protein [Anaerosolibacter carboniphilus]